MSKRTKRFYLATFGCRTNQADSAAVRDSFIHRDFRETESARDADVIVVNSCTVTHRSDQQVRQLTRRLRRENPSARMILTGCYAQRAPSRLAALPAVDAVVGNTRKAEIVRIAEEAPAGNPEGLAGKELAAVYRDDFRTVRAIDPVAAISPGGKTRPLVKIQDGCDAGCTYCIIPAVRGPSRSVPPEQILQQIRELTELGFQEIVLTGIHIGTYGMHFQPRFPFDRLLEEIIRIPGLGRLRVSSIEPMQMSRRIIGLAAASRKIAPHFHICLQSGSDRILKQMRRPYNTSRFAAIVEDIRKRIPDAGIGTDLIAGFPGEGEREHRESLDFVRQMPFTYLHVFPYSKRSGTPAAQRKDQVKGEVIRRRSRELRELSNEKTREFRDRFVGRSLSVLTLTDEAEGFREAISGNYLKAKVSSRVPANQLVNGRVMGVTGEFLLLENACRPAPRMINGADASLR